MSDKIISTAYCIEWLEMEAALLRHYPEKVKILSTIVAQLLAAQEMAKALEYAAEYEGESVSDIAEKALNDFRQAGGE